MSIASTRTMICDKISDEFNSLIQPAQEARRNVRRTISGIKSTLEDLSFSPTSVIDSAVDDLADQVNSSIPETNEEDVDEIVDFVNSCNFLKENDILSNPISLVKSAARAVNSKIEGFIGDFAATLPEFSVGDTLGNILDLLGPPEIPGGLGISDLVKSADVLINCIADRCGSDYISIVSNYSSQLQTIYDDMGLIDDPTDPNWGELDLTKIYNDAGLTPSQITQIDKVKNSIQTAKETGQNALDSASNAVKQRVATSFEAVF